MHHVALGGIGSPGTSHPSVIPKRWEPKQDGGRRWQAAGEVAEVPEDHVSVVPSALQHQKGTQMAPVPPVTKLWGEGWGVFEHKKVKAQSCLPGPAVSVTPLQPITKSQLAACQHSVEVQNVVIALPRHDWSKTSWLSWKDAMTTHELNKQQEEQLF